MEYKKITNLLNTTTDNALRLITKKLLDVHDQSSSAEDRYNPTKHMRFKKSMLRSNLCDFSDAYIVVNCTITVADPNDAINDKKLALKINDPFTFYISKINNTIIDSAEDLNIIKPLYNVIEYSKSYLKTTRSLWNYYTYKPNSEVCDESNNVNHSIKYPNIFGLKGKQYRKIRRY